MYKLPLPIKKHSKYLSEPHLASATHQDRRLGLCATCTRGLITSAMVTAARHRHGDTGPGECDRAGPAREAHAGPVQPATAPRLCTHTGPAVLPRTCHGRSFFGGTRAGRAEETRVRGSGGLPGRPLKPVASALPVSERSWHQGEPKDTRSCGTRQAAERAAGGPHRQTSGAREGGAPTRTPAVSCRKQHLAVSEIQNHF